MRKLNKFISNSTSILGIVMLSIVLGCSVETESVDKNINTLETVLNETFTVPNEELREILEDPNNYTSIGEHEKPALSNNLSLYLEKKYKLHFTEEMYDKYIGIYALSYVTISLEKGEMKMKEVNAEQKENMQNIYDYTAIIDYKRRANTEVKKYEVKGQANFSENGKIAEFIIRTDNNLSMDIISSN